MDFEQLFKPYTEDGHTLDNTIKYLKKTASQMGLHDESVTLAIQQTFAEVSQGSLFSKTKCRCGCGIDKAGTDIVHYMRDKMLAINKEINDAMVAKMSENFTRAVNEAKKSRWTNWNKSPVMRLFGYNKVN